MGPVRHSPTLWTSPGATFTTPPGYVIPQRSTIASVPTGADWPYGLSICTTGWSSESRAMKAKCGFADNSLPSRSIDYCRQGTACGIRAYAGQHIAAGPDAGASGSVVWQPLPDGRVRMLGIMYGGSNCYPCTGGMFRPAWLWGRHSWSSAETAPGYPTGAGGSVLIG